MLCPAQKVICKTKQTKQKQKTNKQTIHWPKPFQLFWFFVCLFCFVCIFSCLFCKEREKGRVCVDLGEMGDGKQLGGVGGEETGIRIYCMKKIYFLKEEQQ